MAGTAAPPEMTAPAPTVAPTQTPMIVIITVLAPTEQPTLTPIPAAALQSAPASSLVGLTWMMTSYNNGRQAVMDAMAETELTAVFGKDGKLSGSSGCNNYANPYVVDGNKIQIGLGINTMMACPQPIMDQETQYLAALQTAATYKIEGTKLELRSATGALLASFAQKATTEAKPAVSNPTVQPTQTSLPTAAPPPPPTTAAKTKPTTAPVPPAVSKPAATTPGVVLDFESFGAWRIGDQKHGSFIASAEQKHGGQTSGKLAYQFPAVANNYVVFRRVPGIAIPGQPAALKLWVYGDGSGHFLNAWVRDSQGEVREFTFGKITHTGWQELEAPLDTAADWPQGHISGTDNGRLDFPISLDSLVLDGVPDGGGPFAGAIYLDDLSTGDVTAPQAVTPALAATTAPAAPAAPPAASGPPAALTGHIVYTSGAGGATGISVLDVANRSTWELHGSARQPDILADGRVVFNGIGGGKDNIFSVNLDGSYERMNSLHPEDSYPSWSPTGVSADDSLDAAGRWQGAHLCPVGYVDRPRAQYLAEQQDGYLWQVPNLAGDVAHCVHRL